MWFFAPSRKTRSCRNGSSVRVNLVRTPAGPIPGCSPAAGGPRSRCEDVCPCSGCTRAPRVVFRALAENPLVPKRIKRSCQPRADSGGTHPRMLARRWWTPRTSRSAGASRTTRSMFVRWGWSHPAPQPSARSVLRCPATVSRSVQPSSFVCPHSFAHILPPANIQPSQTWSHPVKPRPSNPRAVNHLHNSF